VLLYISFFPQLVAGPIVKYHDIDAQIGSRNATSDEIALGLRRFCCGMGKKVLVSNVMGKVADSLFNHAAELSAPGAWVAALAYLMQIYYDFSGYSDMAIGLGHMFGFSFQENFDYPYVSTSIKEFWRRWHISLSTWFKEYVYIPLGGNRKGRLRAGINKSIVFFLCGLWHGAAWTFVVWGLIHGAFSLMEEFVPIRKLPKALGHIYTIFVVTVAFVIFRADNFAQAGLMLRTMFCGWNVTQASMVVLMERLTPLFAATFVAACVLAMPVVPWLKGRFEASGNETVVRGLSYAGSLVLLVLCVVSLSSGTYNPFIYFRF
jgi:alginate O-acetyltransferase complex protein AlgI